MRFLAAMATAASGATARAANQRRALLPTGTPDEVGFRIMWYDPVPPIEKSLYRLEVGGMVEKPLRFSLDDLRPDPKVEQSTRLK